MTCQERPCGSVTKLPVHAVADRAARHIIEFKGPRAVTIDPVGRVCIEAPKAAAEFDLVGVYDPALGLRDLSHRIAEDLLFEARERGFRPTRRSA
jgi:hypothetical protein